VRWLHPDRRSRYNRGMSEEPDKPDGRRSHLWAPALFLTFAILAYEGAHYATAETVYRSGACMGYDTHTIGGKELPLWVHSYFFRPANWIDHNIIDPLRMRLR
jgi:hypothetical protein